MTLPELRPGKAVCLRCGKKFRSRDVSTNRICQPCKRQIDREYVPRIVSSTVYTYDDKAVSCTDVEN